MKKEAPGKGIKVVPERRPRVTVPSVEDAEVVSEAKICIEVEGMYDVEFVFRVSVLGAGCTTAQKEPGRKRYTASPEYWKFKQTC